tara:strand:- start:399 stop:1223 length:825 start_codon:yes stop_codon:yes gene_type:complete
MSSSIEPNSASELERILPLLSGGEPEEELRVRALLALASAEEQALAEAYEADEQALAAYAETQQGDHPIMLGFADSVMARIASETVASQTLASETLASEAFASETFASETFASESGSPELLDVSHADSTRQAPILRPSFSGVQTLMAMAALFLGALGLAILFSAEDAPIAPRGAGVVAGAADPVNTLPEVELPGVSVEAPAEPEGLSEGSSPEFSAPARPGARSRRAPRARRGIVPVDGRGGQQANPLLDALMRGWQPPSRVPPLAEGEREVKF